MLPLKKSSILFLTFLQTFISLSLLYFTNSQQKICKKFICGDLLNNLCLENTNLETFSFENEFLKKEVSKKRIHAQIQEGYFIDMGIPEDYLRANEELNLAE